MGREVSWKDRGANTLIGARHPRIDGVEKATGTAKYAADINTQGTLYAKCLTCKLPHAKVVKLDVEPARAIKGVHSVHVFNDVDSEIHWDGALIAAVAAERPELAEDGVRAIQVEYEELEFWVDEADLQGAIEAGRTKKRDESAKGNVEAALKSAEVVHKGYYGIHTITHMCMEPHGSHSQWSADGDLDVHLSTQNVSGTAGQYVLPLEIDAAKVSITCNYVGGGFGSKFKPGDWGIACAILARDARRPVRLMLDRPTELKIAGTRPSGFAEVTIAADAEGNIVAWDSHHWGTSGIRGETVRANQYPYLFDFDNRNRKATGIITNCGPNDAWRAPSHPQLCALTDTAIHDVATKLGKDSYDVFMQNLNKTPRPGVYASQMEIAAGLMGWKDKWHADGTGGDGPIKRGVGMALHKWGGRAHAATCTVKVHPDGTVESFAGSQDIGTGTRTCIAIVLAETFGLPLSAIRVHIGSNKYPASGPSGGSTTIGGVTGPNRRAALEALWKILDLVAKEHDVQADNLEATGGEILHNNEPVCTWKEACALIGPMPLEVQGQGPQKDGLTDQGVGGVQMADVAVNTETGQVRIHKIVAVQDCGLIIDMLTAESQVYGGVIMGIAYALSEERIMDNLTGRYINADLINYKLPRIGDIGELVVEFYQPDDQYDRGVVGLGEPPVISTGAAISNAVTNAIGIRVPVLPLTPKRVLDALKGGQA